MKLYEIDAGIESCIDEETGEILDFEKLDKLQMERQEKIENIVFLIENTQNDIAGLKEQEEIFAARRQSAEKRVDKLKEYLTYALHGEKFETVKARVTFRWSEYLEIENEKALPVEYMKETVSYKPDTTAIREAIKSGKIVEGARIQERLNPQINPCRRSK